MNLHAIRAIYTFEMSRTFRTIFQSIATPVINQALASRFSSQGGADYGNRVLAMMRKGFGGHAVTKK